MKLFWPVNESFEEALQRIQSEKPNRLFDEQVMMFTQSLSKRFVRMRQLPEVVALGYWLRKANLKQMQKDFEIANATKIVRARGISFHIAPSNVDTIFVYSWMLSLLAGNSNVIRISSKTEVNDILQIILEELQHFETVARKTIICTYGYEENATAILSQACHTRVIWGGDSTVNAIRQIPLAPLANELAFPDRFSLAILDEKQVAQLNDEALNTLLEKFYNDVFWFDQMACASPRLVVWRGQALENFWSKFEAKIQQKQYELLAATQVLKYTTTLQLAVEDCAKKVSPTTYFSRVQLEDIPPHVREQHCGGGLFYEYEVEKLGDVASVLTDKDQTIAYFGFDRGELIGLIDCLTTRGIDRIVPIGQALDFSGVWDGQSFLTSFTREVVVK